jgi:hypothetical protein
LAEIFVRKTGVAESVLALLLLRLKARTLLHRIVQLWKTTARA